MRESIGTVSLLNFIIFFIFLIFAFLMGTFSYYKAYRVNNDIVASIEKYEGHNKFAKDEINEKLNSLGYTRVEFKCPNRGSSKILKAGKKNNTTNVDGISWYCVYEINDTVAYKDTSNKIPSETDVYHSYEVTTIITFKFPVVEQLLKLHVSARTSRIYDFEGSNG